MADYRRIEQQAHRTVYTLPTPTNWVEISKVFAAIRQEDPDATYDDSAWVEGDEDEVRIIVGSYEPEWRNAS